MKKNINKYIYIILIIVFILSIILLGYNSFVKLSYTRKKYDKYTFMIPKELNYTDEYYQGTFKHNKILSSSITLYYGPYDLAKDLMQTYKFYNSDIEVISDYEENIDGKKLYSVTKKVTYFDNDKITYMFSYIYEMDNDSQFVISFECENIDDIKYFMKKLKRTVTSVILY